MVYGLEFGKVCSLSARFIWKKEIFTVTESIRNYRCDLSDSVRIFNFYHNRSLAIFKRVTGNMKFFIFYLIII